MKPLKLPQNKLARLVINVLLIATWVFIWRNQELGTSGSMRWLNFTTSIEFFGLYPIIELLFYVPVFFITRYIWFKESRNRIFYGLIDKLKSNLNKYEPRIYTSTSNADELKKYAGLKDEGIITEEEFQAKKKQILGL
tara:strand:- start:601 stop:1014 length:414 start_codon:yes stop_codon:yes gene_type:complete